MVYRNGVRDEKLTTQLTEAMKGSWLDRSIDAVAKFLDIVGNVVWTSLGIATTITDILGTIGGLAIVSTTNGVGILVGGEVILDGVAVTAEGIAIKVDGVNGLTTSDFTSSDGGRSYNKKFPKGNKEFKKNFGTDENTFHRDIKPEIQKDLKADPELSKWLSKYGENRVNNLGNIVLRATKEVKLFAEK